MEFLLQYNDWNCINLITLIGPPVLSRDWSFPWKITIKLFYSSNPIQLFVLKKHFLVLVQLIMCYAIKTQLFFFPSKNVVHYKGGLISESFSL